MAGYSERIKQETEYSILWCSLGSNGCPIRTRTKPYSSSDTIFNNKGEVSHTEKRCRSVILSVLNSFGVRSSCRSFCGMLRAATGYHPVGVGLILSSLNFAHSLLSQMTPLFCAFRSYTQLLYSTSGTSSAYLQQRWRGSDSRNFFVGKKRWIENLLKAHTWLDFTMGASAFFRRRSRAALASPRVAALCHSERSAHHSAPRRRHEWT